jgi:transglutaminase/protease-like cytokinesis protein 3
VTTHISYDVARFLARDKNPVAPMPGAAEVLSSRMAVCQGYANLFVELCRGAGIEALVIGGYSKQQDKVSEISHAWVAAMLQEEWYLFDPTWGAGFVKDDVFVKRYNEQFYKVTPAKFIERHMPFDPMYQFLSYPVSYP